MLRSSRIDKGKRVSNIVPEISNETISRHLRDLVVTEYGVADLRGKTDEECVRALIEIADSEFQPELSNAAKHAGKLSPDYEVPAHAVNNHADRLGQHHEHFPPYPFGSDFTELELKLLEGLKLLKKMSKLQLAWNLVCALASSRESAAAYLERMDLARPRNIREFAYARLLSRALPK